MSTRDEHFKLTATYCNIAAAGTFVAAVATVPLGAFTTRNLDAWTTTDFVAIFLLGSGFLHGIAQIFLWQAK